MDNCQRHGCDRPPARKAMALPLEVDGIEFDGATIGTAGMNEPLLSLSAGATTEFPTGPERCAPSGTTAGNGRGRGSVVRGRGSPQQRLLGILFRGKTV